MTESLAGWVTAHAERRPEAAAVVGDHETLTYGALEAASNRITRMLREGGCGEGERVGLLMPKTPAAVAAIVGIYKAGGVYVPLDPAHPAIRTKKILDSCRPAWILAARPGERVLGDLLREAEGPRPRIGWLERERPDGPALTARFDALDLDAISAAPIGRGRDRRRDLAHILFTSGSTGAPKGVMITHGNVIHIIEWAVRYFGLSPEDRISCHPPLQFDLSFLDLFGAFAAGARVHLVPPELSLLPNRLAGFIREAALTQWFSVPSLLSYMARFDVLRAPDFPALKRLLWCGEVFPTPALIYWMRRLPHASFTNLYGPTETTIASSYHTLRGCPGDEVEEIPIGTACDGEELLVLDHLLRPVPPAEVGDLYIRGAGLSPGYWNDPVRTRDAFLDDPGEGGGARRMYRTGDRARRGRDGLIYFVGRADAQIKTRGYRVELGEVEAGLSTIECVVEGAVVAIESDDFAGKVICCAYVPAPGAEAPPAALRARLTRVLPPHMVPARWMAFERLPRNANGKIDRARLAREFELREAAAC